MRYRKHRVRLRDLFSPPAGWPGRMRSQPPLDDDDVFEDLMDQEFDIEALVDECREAMLKDIARIARDMFEGERGA